jgi:NAD(P)-dependent dehydrogenase (short-subunit alcohol dehydrogenase family)
LPISIYLRRLRLWSRSRARAAEVHIHSLPAAYLRTLLTIFAIASAHQVNVVNGDQVEAVVKSIVHIWGHLDGAANCAGIWTECPATVDIPDSTFDRDMNVNVKGIFNCLRSELRALSSPDRQQPSSCNAIVNVASTAGLTGWPVLSVYSGAKHAVIGLTKSM